MRNENMLNANLLAVPYVDPENGGIPGQIAQDARLACYDENEFKKLASKFQDGYTEAKKGNINYSYSDSKLDDKDVENMSYNRRAEFVMYEILKNLGFKVAITPTNKDGGADVLVFEKDTNNIIYAVDVKRGQSVSSGFCSDKSENFLRNINSDMKRFVVAFDKPNQVAKVPSFKTQLNKGFLNYTYSLESFLDIMYSQSMANQEMI